MSQLSPGLLAGAAVVVALLAAPPARSDETQQQKQSEQQAQQDKAAQGQSTQGQSGAPSQEQAAGTPAIADIRGISARAMLGKPVRNAEGEEIGEVSDLIIDQEAGVVHPILEVGGFLGMGSVQVLVPLDELDLGQDSSLTLDATRENLKERPSFKAGRGTGLTVGDRDKDTKQVGTKKSE